MEDQQEAILRDMQDTRASMSEKLEALENQVADKVQPVADAVERVTEAAACIAEDVKETVQEVTNKVEETVTAVSSALDLRAQFARRPWLAVGVAATTGCLLATILGRRQRSAPETSADSSPPRTKHGKHGGNGWHRKETQSMPAPKTDTDSMEGLFTEELRRLKGLALASLMNVIREMAKQGLPGILGSRIADEVDTLTIRLGAEPIEGSVLVDTPGKQEDDRDNQRSENKRDVRFNRLDTGSTLQ